MTKICPGCGAEFQYKDPSKIGYSPIKEAKLCERCFKLKNYNQKEVIDLKYNNEDIINLINKSAKNVFYVTDFLNISNKTINIFKEINVKNKYLIINKTDYIPNSINKEKYVDWIKLTYQISEEIILISALKSHNLRQLNNLLIESKDNYICGFTNSGKSTIINKLSELNNRNPNIVTSLMPNTTLDLIKIYLNDETVLYDTPGFIDDDFNEKNYPKKYIKPITIQVKKGDSISINNEVMLCNIDSDNSFTFYMSNDLVIKKAYNVNIKCNNKVSLNDNNDLLLLSYGFVNIKKSCAFTINTDKYEIRNSMF